MGIFRKISFCLVCFLANSTLFSLPKQEILAEITQEYQKSINAGDIKIIEARLSETFSFAGHDPELSRTILNGVLSSKSISIQEILEITASELDGGITLTMNIRMQDGSETIDILKLSIENGEYRISEMSGTILPIPRDPSKYSNLALSGKTNVSIKLIDNPTHILIPVIIEDSLHTFILDNGAPMTIINSKYAHLFKASETQSIMHEAKGVGGDIQTNGELCEINSMNINGMIFSDIQAMTMDLTHLETALGQSFTGLIGVDLISKVLTTVDYSNRILYLDALDSEKQLHLQKEIITTIPFEKELHLLQVKAQLPNIPEKITLIVDSGASAGLLSEKLLEKIPPKHLELGVEDTLIGAGKEISIIRTQLIKKLAIGEISNNYSVVPTDLSNLTIGKKILADGLIGLNFFEGYLVTIDYINCKIELRNHKGEQ